MFRNVHAISDHIQPKNFTTSSCFLEVFTIPFKSLDSTWQEGPPAPGFCSTSRSEEVEKRPLVMTGQGGKCWEEKLGEEPESPPS